MTERLETRPIREIAQRKASEFYLKRVIGNIEGYKPPPVTRRTFEEVEGLVAEKTGFHLPSIAKKPEDFYGSDWLRIYDPSGLSLLMVEGSDPPRERGLINSAHASVEIARRTKRKDGNKGKIFIPSALRIAGIIKDDSLRENERVLALTYGPNGNLTEVNVSISRQEYPTSLYDMPMFGSHLHQELTVSFPRPWDLGQPYKSAGLITNAMLTKVHHSEVIAFKLDQNSFIPGTPSIENTRDDVDYLKKFAEYLGFYLKIADGTVEIGIGSKAAIRIGAEPWKISVPAFLNKA